MGRGIMKKKISLFSFLMNEEEVKTTKQKNQNGRRKKEDKIRKNKEKLRNKRNNKQN